jgi:hypothetical protein
MFGGERSVSQLGAFFFEIAVADVKQVVAEMGCVCEVGRGVHSWMESLKVAV